MLAPALSHSHSSVFCTRMLDRLCCTSGMHKHIPLYPGRYHQLSIIQTNTLSYILILVKTGKHTHIYLCVHLRFLIWHPSHQFCDYLLRSYPHSSEGRQKKQEIQSHRVQKENNNRRKLTKMITWITALRNSVKLEVMMCRSTQGRQVTVESSDKTWSTGGGNVSPLQYSCCENPMNSMKRQKSMTSEDESPRSVSVQYATWEQWRNSSRKNKEAGPKLETTLSCGCAC